MSDNSFIKIIVVGDQNVGKTCILARYSRDQFDSTSPPTLGMDFQSKLLEYKGRTIRLQLWDIAGQERYNAVSKLYVRGAYGAIIVCDVKEAQSLQSSLKWKKMIEESCDWKDGKPIPMILVQNKVDELKGVGLIQPFQTDQSLQEFATTNGFDGAIQSSAKDNTNIPDLFNLVIDRIIAAGGLSDISEKPKDSNYSRPQQSQQSQVQKQPTTAAATTQPSAVKLTSSASKSSKKSKEGKTCC